MTCVPLERASKRWRMSCLGSWVQRTASTEYEWPVSIFRDVAGAREYCIAVFFGMVFVYLWRYLSVFNGHTKPI